MKPLEKASLGGDRNAFLQRDSLAVSHQLLAELPIVIVDDIITSGASMMGCALALLQHLSNTRELACFAAMRTISDPADFKSTRDPINGRIVLRRDGLCTRRP